MKLIRNVLYHFIDPGGEGNAPLMVVSKVPYLRVCTQVPGARVRVMVGIRIKVKAKFSYQKYYGYKFITYSSMK